MNRRVLLRENEVCMSMQRRPAGCYLALALTITSRSNHAYLAGLAWDSLLRSIRCRSAETRSYVHHPSSNSQIAKLNVPPIFLRLWYALQNF